MLILVAVTISMAVNGGLFGYAGKAVGETQNAINAEQQLANLESNLTVDELIEKYSGITASTVASNPSKYYGAVVTNYTLPEANTEEIIWRIFHSDGNNIYLIASDYVKTVPDGAQGSKMSGSEENPYMLTLSGSYNDYSSTETGKYLVKTDNPAKKWIDDFLLDSDQPSMRATAYLIDTDQWNNLYKGEKADYAMGTPTLKLFAESYNATHVNQIEYIESKMGVFDGEYNYGYFVKSSEGNYDTSGFRLNNENLAVDDLYIISSNERSMGMWIASPIGSGDVWEVFSSGDVLGGYLVDGPEWSGVRPVVCLSDGIALETVTDGNIVKYKIK